MRDKPRASPSVGLEITLLELRGAVLSYQNQKINLDRLFSILLDQEHSTSHHVKPLYINQQEKQLHDAADKGLVVTGLVAKDVLIRNLDLQLTKEKDIEEVAAFQAEPLLPYTLEEGVVDWQVLEKEKESTKLTLAAAKNEVISQHLEQWHSINIEPEVIGCAPGALAAFSSLFVSSEGTHIHLHFGYLETTCVLVKKGKLAAAQTIRSGVKDWAEALSMDLGLTFERAQQELIALEADTLSEKRNPELSKAYQKLAMEVTRVVYALSKQSGQEAMEILVTGEGAEVPQLPQTVCRNLKMKVVFPEQMPGFIHYSVSDLQKNAISIGLALSGLTKGPEQFNFRQKEFVFPDPWKRIKQPMAVYLGLCLLFAASLYYFGVAYIAEQEDKIRSDYVNLLGLMKKPFKEFEKQIRPKGSPETSVENRTALSLSQQDIQYRLSVLDKEIRSTPDIFPLLPNTPRVSDLLAWLCTLPQVSSQDQETGGKPRLLLESLSYKMVKRPEQSKMREKYQVKVELEISTQTPRYAREFHDFLLAPNEMVEPSGDVKWSAERDRYRATFILKDKTVYPTVK